MCLADAIHNFMRLKIIQKFETLLIYVTFLWFLCYLLINPFNAELLGTLASPPLNSWRGGGGRWYKKSEYFVMSDLYEDTSRILAYEQIIT